MNPKRLLVLSLLSGVLSYLSVSLPRMLEHRYPISDDAFWFFPGVFFGVFLLLPLASRSTQRELRWVGLMIISVVAWLIAVSVGFQVLPLTTDLPILSCGLSGSIGALILAVGSRTLIPIRSTRPSVFSALFSGFVGGCFIGWALSLPRGSVAGECLYLIGFLTFQSGVALALFRRHNVSEGADS
jgi:hypothetical protein